MVHYHGAWRNNHDDQPFDTRMDESRLANQQHVQVHDQEPGRWPIANNQLWTKELVPHALHRVSVWNLWRCDIYVLCRGSNYRLPPRLSFWIPVRVGAQLHVDCDSGSGATQSVRCNAQSEEANVRKFCLRFCCDFSGFFISGIALAVAEVVRMQSILTDMRTYLEIQHSFTQNFQIAAITEVVPEA